MTESYGPISTHVQDPDWIDVHGLTDDQMLSKCTYQVGDITIDSLKVFNSDTMIEVPADGTTIGEIMIRGNILMKGYLNNEQATAEAFKDGYFHTGDLGVSHANGRVEIKDRLKDVIISGGENISSIEVENIIITHPYIEEAAVIAMPHAQWGEVPCCFYTLKSQYKATSTHVVLALPSNDEMIAWAKTMMASFQTPKRFIYIDSLPKTSTGKVQKNLLRNLL